MLKIIAILAMVGDHVNHYIFLREYFVLTFIGRIAFPLFIYMCVKSFLFYTRDQAKYIERLILFGLITFFMYDIWKPSLYPLNVLFSLAIGIIILYGIEHRRYRLFLFVPLALFVDYTIFGLFAFVSYYYFLKNKTLSTALFAIAATLGLNEPQYMFSTLIFFVLAAADMKGYFPQIKQWGGK